MTRFAATFAALTLALGTVAPRGLDAQFPETMMYDHVHLAVPQPPEAEALRTIRRRTDRPKLFRASPFSGCS